MALVSLHVGDLTRAQVVVARFAVLEFLEQVASELQPDIRASVFGEPRHFRMHDALSRMDDVGRPRFPTTYIQKRSHGHGA